MEMPSRALTATNPGSSVASSGFAIDHHARLRMEFGLHLGRDRLDDALVDDGAVQPAERIAALQAVDAREPLFAMGFSDRRGRAAQLFASPRAARLWLGLSG
jgi:hypothetical protein